jgi:hypothetical protein
MNIVPRIRACTRVSLEPSVVASPVRVTSIVANVVQQEACVFVPVSCGGQSWHPLPPGPLTAGATQRASCRSDDGRSCLLHYENGRLAGVDSRGFCVFPLTTGRHARVCASPIVPTSLTIELRDSGDVSFKTPEDADSVVVEVDVRGQRQKRTLTELFAAGIARQTQTQGETLLFGEFFTTDVVLTLAAECPAGRCGPGDFELEGGEKHTFDELPKVHQVISAKNAEPLPWTVHLKNGGVFRFRVSRSKGDFTCKVKLPPVATREYLDATVCEP